MKKTKSLIMNIFIIFVVTSSVNATITVCQSGCNYTSINDALTAAQDGDVIEIIWENSDDSTYTEYLHVTKDVVITSSGADIPRIEYDLSTNPENEIIKIDVEDTTPDDTPVTIERLVIRNSGTVSPNIQLNDMTSSAGIRVSKLDGTDCLINNCRIQHNHTAIVIENRNAGSDPNCRTEVYQSKIGPDVNDRDFWEFTNDGNLFGIVQVASDRMGIYTQPGEYADDVISECSISGSYFHGIVLRGGSKAVVRNNIIAFNGNKDFNLLNYKSSYAAGGLLVLAEEGLFPSQYTDVKMQTPLILSNSIYGNKGNQVSVLRVGGQANDLEIVNFPLLISNTIGTHPFYDTDNYLIACRLPEMQDSQIGSGIFNAFNNVYRETDGDKKYYSHPMKNTPTVTPTKTQTPTVTATVNETQTPTATLPPTPPPTQIPFTPRPSPTPYPTHTSIPTPTASPPIGYNIGSYSWSILDNHHDPQFVGSDTPVPGDFDFHVQDPYFNATPMPTGTQNPVEHGVINRTLLKLNPGKTNRDGSIDLGWVDIGRHWPPRVPSAENLGCYAPSKTYSFYWTNPENYTDGSLFDDIEGVIFHFLYRSKTGYTVLSTDYLEVIEEAEYHVSNIPDKANYFGIVIFNSEGEESEYMAIHSLLCR